mmetsp:Transcript_99316/g.318664  ORF Transcript_99316/g.318664 Transcript_99316/m.318664 type:complete len:663 (+) Transcript_99316:93-2081(+)
MAEVAEVTPRGDRDSQGTFDLDEACAAVKVESGTGANDEVALAGEASLSSAGRLASPPPSMPATSWSLRPGRVADTVSVEAEVAGVAAAGPQTAGAHAAGASREDYAGSGGVEGRSAESVAISLATLPPRLAALANPNKAATGPPAPKRTAPLDVGREARRSSATLPPSLPSQLVVFLAADAALSIEQRQQQKQQRQRPLSPPTTTPTTVADFSLSGSSRNQPLSSLGPRLPPHGWKASESPEGPSPARRRPRSRSNVNIPSAPGSPIGAADDLSPTAAQHSRVPSQVSQVSQTSRQPRRSRSSDSITPVMRRSCPLCLEPMSADIRESFCGVHACCFACASACAREQLARGKLPQCFDINCRENADPLVAMRFLQSSIDKERYLQLALWSNPRIWACPKCHCLLYAESGPPAGGCSSCPSCKHVFCVDCRCPKHDGESCQKALEQEHERLVSRPAPRKAAASASGRSPRPVQPSSKSPAMAARRSPRYQPASPRPMLLASLSPGGDDKPLFERSLSPLPRSAMQKSFSFGALESDVHLNGFKCCPRCRVGVEKSDDGCEHLRCWQCGHEFCWLCLADRKVIFAHGNHFHRPGCKIFAEYSGPNDYLPDRCDRCALRGKACETPFDHSPMVVGQYYSALLDACSRWFQHGLFFSTCSVATVV